MSQDRVIIFDTTLRDGIHGFPKALSLNQKVEIARHLALLQVDVLEAGFPGAHPEDTETLQDICRKIRGPRIAALARMTEQDIEAAAKSLEGADTNRLHLYLATGPADKDRAASVEAIKEGLRLARKFFEDIEFSPHNATRTRPEVLIELIQAAVDAGVRTINISDTLGYAIPDEFAGLIRRILKEVSNTERIVFSVHCHNDLGMATANSLAGLLAGARQVECSVNGLGDRAGNAPLEEIVMALKTRRDFFGLECGVDTTHIQPTSDRLAELAEVPIPVAKPVVGEKAIDFQPDALRNGFQNNESYAIINAHEIGRNRSTDT